jgi:hypothetical protein
MDGRERRRRIANCGLSGENLTSLGNSLSSSMTHPEMYSSTSGSNPLRTSPQICRTAASSTPIPAARNFGSRLWLHGPSRYRVMHEWGRRWWGKRQSQSQRPSLDFPTFSRFGGKGPDQSNLTDPSPFQISINGHGEPLSDLAIWRRCGEEGVCLRVRVGWQGGKR